MIFLIQNYVFDKFKMKLDFTMAFKHFPLGDKVLRQVNY